MVLPRYDETPDTKKEKKREGGGGGATHLAASINLLEEIPGQGVPKSQLLVRRSAPARENPVLVRVPRDRLDGCDVIGEPM